MAKTKENKESVSDTQQTRHIARVPMNDDLKDKVEIMVVEDAGQPDNANTAAFFRKLAYQEWQRREQVKKVTAKLQSKGLLPTH